MKRAVVTDGTTEYLSAPADGINPWWHMTLHAQPLLRITDGPLLSCPVVAEVRLPAHPGRALFLRVVDAPGNADGDSRG